MNNYIVINGKKTELTDEQLKALGLKLKCPYDRAEINDVEYYNVDGIGCICSKKDNYSPLDSNLFNNANYCTDKCLAEQDRLHDLLRRLLRRFTYQNGWSEDLWYDLDKTKYSVCYDYDNEHFDIYVECSNKSNCIYFISEEIAQRAITEVIEPFIEQYPEFVW